LKFGQIRTLRDAQRQCFQPMESSVF
jgi:hypothetical protein